MVRVPNTFTYFKYLQKLNITTFFILLVQYIPLFYLYPNEYCITTG